MSLTQIASDMISGLGYLGLFMGLFLDSFGVPIPSEVLIPVATVLGLQGRFDMIAVFLIGTLAQVLSGLVGYFVGRYAGREVIERYGKYLLISKRDLHRTERTFEKYGPMLTLAGRCVPVIRGLIAYPAGIAEMPLRRFLIYTTIGSAVWTAFLMYLGYLLSNNLELIDKIGHQFSILIVLALLAAIAWHFRHLFEHKVRRGR